MKLETLLDAVERVIAIAFAGLAALALGVGGYHLVQDARYGPWFSEVHTPAAVVLQDEYPDEILPGMPPVTEAGLENARMAGCQVREVAVVPLHDDGSGPPGWDVRCPNGTDVDTVLSGG